LKMNPTQTEMDAMAAEFEAAFREESRMNPVGAAASIINLLRRGDFSHAKHIAKIDRDKFYCQRKTLAVLEKHFGCMLHGVVDCSQCRKH